MKWMSAEKFPILPLEVQEWYHSVREERFENALSLWALLLCQGSSITLRKGCRIHTKAPSQSTHFNRAFLSHNGFQIWCAGSCFEWLNPSEPCSGSALPHLPSQLHRCFSETNPDPREWKRALQSGTIPGTGWFCSRPVWRRVKVSYMLSLLALLLFL